MVVLKRGLTIWIVLLIVQALLLFHFYPSEWTLDVEHIPNDVIITGRTEPLYSTSISNSNNYSSSSSSRRIVFVHIGKAGGSSARCQLDPFFYEDQCASLAENEDYRSNTTAISKQVVELVHKAGRRTLVGRDIEQLPSIVGKSFLDTDRLSPEVNHLASMVYKYDSFLFVIRNPFDRIVSWFYYEPHLDVPFHYNKHLKKLKSCYSSIEEVGTAIGSFEILFIISNSTTSTTTNIIDLLYPWHEESKLPIKTKCIALARHCLTGYMPCKFHNYFNYMYYSHHVLKEKKEIFVVRNERLWTDWEELNLFLGGNTHQFSSNSSHLVRRVRETDKHNNDKNKKNPSNEARNNICKLLCEEIGYYLSIVKAATNLSEEDLQSSIYDINKSCALEDITTICTKQQLQPFE